MNGAPLFSVVMPVYNAAKYLRKAVESVRAQRCEDWELLAINDGSTDESERILDEAAAADFRVRVLSKRNGGVSSARNAGLAEARGRYIGFLDSDDLWKPNHLAAAQSALDSLQCDMTVSRGGSFDDVGRDVAERAGFSDRERDRFPTSLIRRNFLLPTSIVIRHDFVCRVGNFDEDPRIQHAEDWDYWIRCISAGARLSFLDANTFRYRRHDGAATARDEMMHERMVFCLRKHQKGSFGSPGDWGSSLASRLRRWAAFEALRSQHRSAGVHLKEAFITKPGDLRTVLATILWIIGSCGVIPGRGSERWLWRRIR